MRVRGRIGSSGEVAEAIRVLPTERESTLSVGAASLSSSSKVLSGPPEMKRRA
jgi:hypothetical protein